MPVQGPSVNGITNLGNTCYLNAALSCLFKVQPLVDYFANDLHLQETNLENPLGSKGEISASFAKLAKYQNTDLGFQHHSITASSNPRPSTRR